MRHPKLNEWDKRLKSLFDEIDDYLEDTYGRDYKLHPNRASRGRTANKESDGLFNVGANFSAGYGSNLGRGYVIDVDMVTLENVPDHIREKIEAEVVEQVEVRLPRFFPERKLRVSRDGNLYKIHGDFSLGNL